jgi:hypothetical protein
MARQQARRRQRERIAGVFVVCVGVVVLVVAIFALREPSGHVSAGSQHTSPSSVAKQSATQSTKNASPTKKASPTTKSSGSAPDTTDTNSGSSVKSVPLVVLNNTTISGLAGQASTRFEDGGWTVSSHGNYQNDIVSTCAYYDPSVSGAKAAAEALQAQYPTIKRVKPKFDGLPSGPIVVVLTPDYSAA